MSTATTSQPSTPTTAPTPTMSIQEKQAPTPVDFRVPTNLVEHNLIVARLVEGGSFPAEAEATIAGRMTAFNKALCEYKKEQSQKGSGPKKQTRKSNNVSATNTQNGI